MKLVLAIVPPSRMEAVRQALAEVQVTRLSITDGHGYQQAGGNSLQHAPGAQQGGQRIVRHAVLEIAVNDDFLDRTVQVLERALRLAAAAEESNPADEPVGDPGGVYVMPMDTAVQIYRDVRGPEAL
jgi:nitrogen regulatory protein P-II 1